MIKYLPNEYSNLNVNQDTGNSNNNNNNEGSGDGAAKYGVKEQLALLSQVT